MKKTLIILTIAIAGIIISGLIFGAGYFVSRVNFGLNGDSLTRMNQGRVPWINMGRNSNNIDLGYGMMGRNYNGTGAFGMMGYGDNDSCGLGMMGNSYRSRGGDGMMGWFGSDNDVNVEPISMETAKQVVEKYLKELNNSDLELKEIMIFDNNGYAIIVEKSTGIGAMELLIDPASLSVFPEYGPNMIWNLKYGHMGGNGMMGGYGGMMGSRYDNSGSTSTSMTVSAEQALTAAQDYLDQEFPGYQTADEATRFYGYYTIDILKDGIPTGMLSVNGFNQKIFLHTWHGTFIEMFE
ncbi:MAG: hypothetical protein RBT01_14560 [Anaerolineaceae bacterium]|jgi:hypothetical protein|nr:hypothetical protein [Anaerolineaceae bacterium]